MLIPIVGSIYANTNRLYPKNLYLHFQISPPNYQPISPSRIIFFDSYLDHVEIFENTNILSSGALVNHRKSIRKGLSAAFPLAVNNIIRWYGHGIRQYFVWKASPESVELMWTYALFTNVASYLAKHLVNDLLRLHQILCYMPHQLFKAVLGYMPTIFNLKRHGHWFKFDGISYSLAMHVFIIFKVVPQPYKPAVGTLLFYPCHTQKSNLFQLFL